MHLRAWLGLGLAVLLVQPLTARGGDVAAAKRDLRSAKSWADDRKWTEVAGDLQKVQADLEGLTDAEKAPVLAGVAEIKAAATQDILKDINQRIDRTGMPKSADEAGMAKMEYQQALLRLKQDDVQALVDPAVIQATESKIGDLLGGGKKPMSDPAATATPPDAKRVAPPAATDSDEVAQVKRDLKTLASIAPEHNWDALEESVKKAEFDLGMAAAADRPPFAAKIDEYKRMIEMGRGGERVAQLQKSFDDLLHSGYDSLGRNQFNQAEDSIDSCKKMLGKYKGRELLTADAAKECDVKIAALEQALREGILKDKIERAAISVKELEAAYAQASKNGHASGRMPADVAQLLSQSKSLLQDLPAKDAQVQAVQARLDAVNKQMGSADDVADKTAAEAEVVRRWQIAQKEFEGWEAETAGPTWSAYSKGVSAKLIDLLMPKTLQAMHGTSHFLNDGVVQESVEKYKNDAVIQSTLSEANTTLATAAAKFDGAFGKLMDQAEAAPAPKNARDLREGGRLVSESKRWFDGTTYKEANADRARKLRDKWNDAVTGAANKANELNKKLIEQATAAWPAIEGAVNCEQGFDPSDPKWQGKTIELKGVFNRAGWDFDGHYDFAMKINGIPVAGAFAPNIRKIFNETQQRTKQDIDDHIKWDVIAVVQGPGQINQRTTSEVVIKGSNEKLKVESYPPVPCVVLKVIALHAGPVAAGPE